MPPIWPVGPRRVLAATVIAAALGLAVESRAVDPPPGDGIVAAPKLKLDPNTAPPQVLGALPQVGPTLVRQLVLARQDRPLTSLDDLRGRVRGLGPATLDQLAPYLRLEPAAG
ncbi:MAG TPA: helix-hairpin-helix domain-containing protein, partial [Isosphaeraceae bacterium]|nr:helix-hairpin-helix domain-containing protein [Isosphaeraceae bacterium]